VETALSGEDAVEKLASGSYQLLITDLNLKGITGMEVLRAAKERDPDSAVIMITAYGSEKIAVEAMKAGATDYLPKPFDNDELELVVERVLEGVSLRRDLKLLREQVAERHGLERLVGKSPAMQRVFDVIRKVADTDLTVLIRGLSGTGKELVANAIHQRSPPHARPLIKVNCAAFSRELVESELFGHEKGAFTGATTTREGKFEIADGGTLLLDEIGDMALETQAKILRVLQERELERVAGTGPSRWMSGSWRPPTRIWRRRYATGPFARTSATGSTSSRWSSPPLRERPEDLPLLIESFLGAAANRLGRPPRPLEAGAYRALLAHEWPGNVRELEHALEQAVALASGEQIELGDLPPAVQDRRDPGPGDDEGPPGSFRDAKQRVIERFERQFITEALIRHLGNISKAAEDMGMYRQHLQLKLADYGIDAEQFRRRGER
jgi:DNA-binding NtrC family response regulator